MREPKTPTHGPTPHRLPPQQSSPCQEEEIFFFQNIREPKAPAHLVSSSSFLQDPSSPHESIVNSFFSQKMHKPKAPWHLNISYQFSQDPPSSWGFKVLFFFLRNHVNQKHQHISRCTEHFCKTRPPSSHVLSFSQFLQSEETKSLSPPVLLHPLSLYKLSQGAVLPMESPLLSFVL